MKKFIRGNKQIQSPYDLSKERLASIADSIADIASRNDSNDVKMEKIERILKFYDLL